MFVPALPGDNRFPTTLLKNYGRIQVHSSRGALPRNLKKFHFSSSKLRYPSPLPKEGQLYDRQIQWHKVVETLRGRITTTARKTKCKECNITQEMRTGEEGGGLSLCSINGAKIKREEIYIFHSALSFFVGLQQQCSLAKQAYPFLRTILLHALSWNCSEPASSTSSIIMFVWRWHFLLWRGIWIGSMGR